MGEQRRGGEKDRGEERREGERGEARSGGERRGEERRAGERGKIEQRRGEESSPGEGRGIEERKGEVKSIDFREEIFIFYDFTYNFRWEVLKCIILIFHFMLCFEELSNTVSLLFGFLRTTAARSSRTQR